MGGLVQYESSDEESAHGEVDGKGILAAKATATAPVEEGDKSLDTCTEDSVPHKPAAPAAPAASPGPKSAPIGPALPPPQPVEIEVEGLPQSPYTANRALLHDLTLPPVPNVDMPPSPPGSPPPDVTKKFEQFLALKKQGVHFNSKISQSKSVKNPSLMDKLLDFVDVSGADQYATSLPPDLWNPLGFPGWAFRTELKKSQDEVRKGREEERRNGARSEVEFVAASGAGTG